MSEDLSDKELHDYLEQIAARGCADVNQLIIEIKNGANVPEIAHLSEAQQQQVIEELSGVMKVYDSCEIDPE